MKAANRNSFVFAIALATGGFALAQQPTTPAPPDSKPISPAAQELPDSPTPQAAALTHPNGPSVVFDTSMGRITCQFYEKQSPKTVANFIGLA